MSYDEDEILFSETLLEDEEQAEEEEDEARGYLDPDERLLAIIEGSVDGQSALNRLAVTDSRIIFYPAKRGLLSAFKKTSAVSIDYCQIVAVQGKKGVLLGEINISTKDSIIRFKDMAKDDVDQISNLIQRLRKKSTERTVTSVTREKAIEQLKKLAELREMGAITEEEFQEKRKKLLEHI